MDLYVLIKQIRVSDELIAPDLVLGVHETAVSLRIRKGERELVEIEFHRAPWRKHVLGDWRDAVRAKRRVAEEVSQRRPVGIGRQTCNRARLVRPGRNRSGQRESRATTASLESCRLYGLAFVLRNGGLAEKPRSRFAIELR